MTPRRERRFPRLAAISVALVALGISGTLVSVALRSSERARAPKAEPTAETVKASGLGIFAECTNCHKDLDKVFERGGNPGLLYRHENHFAKGVSDCAQCHPANTHEADLINKPTMSRCFTCHGLTEVAIAPGKCTTCHPQGYQDRPPDHLAKTWRQVHGDKAKQDMFVCTTCHEEKKFCDSCHGTSMPHAQDWKELPHAVAFFDAGAGVCARCHPRGPTVKTQDSCDSCHHTEGPKNVSWRSYHPNVVKKQGGGQCFECHNPSTCASCHVRGREDYSADRENLSAPPTPTPTPTASAG